MIAFASIPTLPELPSFTTAIGMSSVNTSLEAVSVQVTFTNLFSVLCEKLEASIVASYGAEESTTLALLFVNVTSVAVVEASESTRVNVTLFALIPLSVAVNLTSWFVPPGVRAFEALNLICAEATSTSNCAEGTFATPDTPFVIVVLNEPTSFTIALSEVLLDILLCRIQ